jgi:hypothetical protein
VLEATTSGHYRYFCEMYIRSRLYYYCSNVTVYTGRFNAVHCRLQLRDTNSLLLCTFTLYCALCCSTFSRTFLLALYINVFLPTSFATRSLNISQCSKQNTYEGVHLAINTAFFASDHTRKTDTQFCNIFRRSPYAMHKMNMKGREPFSVTLSSLLAAWFSMQSTLYRTILWCWTQSASIQPTREFRVVLLVSMTETILTSRFTVFKVMPF